MSFGDLERSHNNKSTARLHLQSRILPTVKVSLSRTTGVPLDQSRALILARVRALILTRTTTRKAPIRRIILLRQARLQFRTNFATLTCPLEMASARKNRTVTPGHPVAMPITLVATGNLKISLLVWSSRRSHFPKYPFS